MFLLIFTFQEGGVEGGACIGLQVSFLKTSRWKQHKIISKSVFLHNLSAIKTPVTATVHVQTKSRESTLKSNKCFSLHSTASLFCVTSSLCYAVLLECIYSILFSAEKRFYGFNSCKYSLWSSRMHQLERTSSMLQRTAI